MIDPRDARIAELEQELKRFRGPVAIRLTLEQAAKLEAQPLGPIMSFQDWLDDSTAKVRAIAFEEAATVAESYEPHCESCPRGVAHAIRALK